MEVVAALAGAVIGGLLTAVAGYWFQANVLNFQQRYWARRDLAVALLSELSAVRERYWRVFGKYIQEELAPGQPLTLFGARVTTQNFTVVYDNNSDKLGLFEPNTAVIVHAMTVGKGHIESIGQAYEAVGEIVTQMHESMRVGLVDAAEKFDAIREETLIKYGDSLREESRQAVAATDAAIAVLHKYASLGPAPGAWDVIWIHLGEVWTGRRAFLK